jgi:DNA gyrase/topoisomerase IV subunit A
MLDYSVYKLIQQLPFLMDGVSQTQRKIIWTLLNKSRKKYKTADSYSLIYEYTNYLHGNASAENVWNTLAADYKNNLNLLTPKGSFGYRVIHQPASPRYTSAILSKITDKLFIENDKKIRVKQHFEGKEIEPTFLLPILPLALINGISGIAVGYSSNVIPRDPIFILNLIKGILEKKISKIPKYIPVKFPYYSGKIENGDNDKQFIFYGKIEKGKCTKRFGTLIINEVPPLYDREKMVKIINDLIDSGKAVDFNDSCTKNNFHFEIKVPIEIYDLSIDNLIDLFKLKVKQTEVLTFIKTDNELNWKETGSDGASLENKDNFSKGFKKEIKIYDNTAQYLHDWIIDRLKWYHKRKTFILDNIKYHISIFEEKIRFIQAIIDKDIILEKKKKTEIINQIKTMEFIKIDGKYDYLLNMPLWSLSEEKLKEFAKNIRELKKEYRELAKKEPRELWLSELNEVEKMLILEAKNK